MTWTRTALCDSMDLGGGDATSSRCKALSRPALAEAYVQARIVLGHPPSAIAVVIVSNGSWVVMGDNESWQGEESCNEQLKFGACVCYHLGFRQECDKCVNMYTHIYIYIYKCVCVCIGRNRVLAKRSVICRCQASMGSRSRPGNPWQTRDRVMT